jgi:hypothetical protein
MGTAKPGAPDMKYPKRSQYKHCKKPYRNLNWPKYEAGLRQRGSLTIWLSGDAIKGWRAPKSGRPGGQRVYSRSAIETAVTIRMVYNLHLRQAEGFLASVFQFLDINLLVPDHTTVSRRAKKLGKVPIASMKGDKPVHLLIDSTGLRIHVGNLRKPPKRRAWRKLHLAVDRETGEILGADLSSSRARDASRVPALLSQIEPPLASTSADGAYDTEGVYKNLAAHGPERTTKVIIPPGKEAIFSSNPALQDRNRHIRAIEKLGRRQWYNKSGFTMRSLVENTVYRYKQIIGREMRARSLAAQRVEARIGCRILNRMACLGMPESCRVDC